MNDLRREELLSIARAYLEWETELSGFGLPEAGRAHCEIANRRGPVGESRARAQGQAGVAAQVASTSSPAPATGGAAEAPILSSSSTLEREPAAAPPATSDRRVRLAQLEAEVRSCTRCELAKTRTQTVFARGNPESPLMFVGEGPGQEEDRLGQPFVGPAGQLLDRMVAAMGFARDDVYVANVVKCRPPGNRTPLPSEAGACSSFLIGQLEAVRPRVIVALGRCATENLGLVEGGGWRGRWGRFRGVDVMPTYHPAFLLRSPEFKRPVWEDLQKVMERLKDTG